MRFKIQMFIDSRYPTARQSKTKYTLNNNIKTATLKDFTGRAFSAAADMPFQAAAPLNENPFCQLLPFQRQFRP